MGHVIRLLLLGPLGMLAACAADSPPPAPLPEIPVRGGYAPEGSVLLLQIPTASPVRYAGRADLSRGGPGVCAESAEVLVEPAGGDRFQVYLDAPGFLVTPESTLRYGRAGFVLGQASQSSLALNLAGANNGRCDYVIRMQRQG
jgi:hypothetical protein